MKYAFNSWMIASYKVTIIIIIITFHTEFGLKDTSDGMSGHIRSSHNLVTSAHWDSPTGSELKGKLGKQTLYSYQNEQDGAWQSPCHY